MNTMRTEEKIRKYLPTKNVIQLATARDNQPWACNVHYFSDEDLNLYWISEPGRRHSLEIQDNKKVAAVIKIHENTEQENYVIGIAIEGTAQEMESFDETIAASYRDKLSKGESFVEDMKSGKKPYKFYKLTPKKFVLFDTQDFTGDPRKEWILA